MQLYLIRHGQSTNNAIWQENQYNQETRVADPLLTEIGVRQAEITGEFLARSHVTRLEETGQAWDPQNREGFFLTHLYCSLMERAIQTGTILSQKTGLPLVGLPDVHELGGIYREILSDGRPTIEVSYGITPQKIAETYPSLILRHSIPDQGWWVGGKEEVQSRITRAKRVVQFLKDHHSGTDDRVAVVTHGSFSALLYRVLLSLDMIANIDIVVRDGFVSNNCGITRFDQYGSGMAMMYYNRADHLPDDLIT